MGHVICDICGEDHYTEYHYNWCERHKKSHDVRICDELEAIKKFPALKLAQFLAMAQAYNNAWESYFKYRGDNELHASLRKQADQKRLRYEGWLIGFLDGVGGIDYPSHQEFAMRIVRNAFNTTEE